MEGMRCSTTPSDPVAVSESPEVVDGIISQWLVTGPFPVKNSVAESGISPIGDETALHPKVGDKAGEKVWKPLTITMDPWSFGTTELPFTDVGREVGNAINQIGYAYSSIYCTRAGRLRAVVDHSFGLCVWVNGKQVYCDAQRQVGLGSYAQLSNHARALTTPVCRDFEFDVERGWNRLLCKTSSANREGYNEMRFCLRLADVPSVPYDSKNIAWMAELPNRGNATPVISGGRIFVASEPDDLVCLDAATGKRLWIASNNYYDAMPQATRDADPRFAKVIAPLAAKLSEATDPAQRLDARRQLQEALLAIDKKKFNLRLSGHLASHFGIVGFATPTPCADGKNVYVWFGNGVAACYDLEGHRRWITRVDAEILNYACSPALIGGKLVVFMDKLIAFDAATGAIAWEQPSVEKNIGAILPARLAGVDVIVSQRGEIVRAADGHVLWDNPDKVASDSAWSPPVIIGQTIYLPCYGVKMIAVVDCAGATGDPWKLTPIKISDYAVDRRPDGSWVDRPTAGSSLVYEGLAYDVDIWSTFYAVDLVARKLAYRQDVALHGLFHYNSIPIAASPTLAGGHVYILDNQGTTLVIEPGRTFKQVACNRIATELPRTSTIPAQEAISYGPIVAYGDRLYLRGERYLYCIAKE